MNMGGHGDASVKLAQHRYAARDFVFVQDEKFDARIGTRLPGLVLDQRNILEHGGIQRAHCQNASQVFYRLAFSSLSSPLPERVKDEHGCRGKQPAEGAISACRTALQRYQSSMLL